MERIDPAWRIRHGDVGKQLVEIVLMKKMPSTIVRSLKIYIAKERELYRGKR